MLVAHRHVDLPALANERERAHLHALAELAGTWTITSEGRRGPQESTLVIVAAEGSHSGSITGPRGLTREISEINVTGEAFTFENEVSTRMGDFTLSYQGTAKGDAMQGNIETPMGDLRTVKLRRVRENGARRETVFWLAPAYDFLLVRMFQRERNGTRFELVIRSLEQPDEPRA